MNVKDLHRSAIELARNAKLQLEDNKIDEYKHLIYQAYLLESQAAAFYLNKLDVEPTRSVLYRSAATLAFESELYAESIELISQALLGNPFEEIKVELIDLLKKSVGLRTENKTDIKKNNYLTSIRNHSFNIKVEQKTAKYAGAFVVSDVIEVLKGLDLSYQNYGEAKFSNEIKKDSLPDFEFSKNKFKRQCTLLGVGTSFSSFGISISVDNSIMDHPEIYTKEFRDMKHSLFEEFKQDVILPSYDDPGFQKRISEKFNEEERRNIFTPIVNVISKSKGFKISVTDDNYDIKIKEFKHVDNLVKEKLIPKNSEILNVEDNTNLIRKIEQITGSKKSVISSEQMKYFELIYKFKEIESNKKKVYFNNEVELLIVFDINYFRIEDNTFDINVSHKDYHSLISEYNKLFINRYTHLLDNLKSLSDDEFELLNLFQSTTVRDW